MDDRTRALEQLYRERYATLRDVLAGVTGSYETARDVVQRRSRAPCASAANTAARDHSKRGSGGSRSDSRSTTAETALVSLETDQPARSDPHANGDLRAAIRRLPARRRLVVFLATSPTCPTPRSGRSAEISEALSPPPSRRPETNF